MLLNGATPRTCLLRGKMLRARIVDVSTCSTMKKGKVEMRTVCHGSGYMQRLRRVSVQTTAHLLLNVTAVWSHGFSMVTVHDTTAGGCGWSALFEEEKTRSTWRPMFKGAKTGGKKMIERVSVHE
jgi:hypothetical protein